MSEADIAARTEALEAAFADAQRRLADVQSRLSELERRATSYASPQAPPSSAPTRQPAAPVAAPGVVTSPPPPAPPAQPPPAPAAPPARAYDRGFDFEELLGRRLLAWLGGITVLLGVVLFLVAAASRGWLGVAARVSLAFAGSTLLLLLGVWLHEQRGKTQAARVTVAASIAALYASLAAATARYDVVSQPSGLLIAGVVAVVAGSLAVRWSAKEIAGLGIVGALLAPVLVDTGTSSLALAFVALALVGVVIVVLWQRWSWLSTIAYLVSLPQLIVWALDERHESMRLTIGVLIAFWLLYLVAAIGYELRDPTRRLRAEAAMLAIGNAVVTTSFGYALLRDEVSTTAGTVWVLVMAALHVGVGTAAARKRRSSREVALVLAAVGVGLSAIGFALALDGPALVSGWAVEAVLLGWLALRTGSRRALVGSLGLFGAAVVRALEYEVDRIHGHLTGSGVDGAALAALGVVVVASAALAWIVERREWTLAAPRSLLPDPHAPEDEEPLRVDAALAEILRFASVALVAVALDVAASGGWLVFAWTAAAVTLVLLNLRLRSAALALGATTLLALATLHVLSMEVPVNHALSSGLDSIGGGFAASALGCVGWIVAALVVEFEHLFGEENGASVRAACLLAGGALGFYLASVLILTLAPQSANGSTPAGHALVSAFWGVSGFLGVLLGLVGRKPLLRHAGLLLLGLALGKVFVYDLRSIGQIARVFSLLVLGLLLLAAAFVYQRLARSIDSRTRQ